MKYDRVVVAVVVADDAVGDDCSNDDEHLACCFEADDYAAVDRRDQLPDCLTIVFS